MNNKKTSDEKALNDLGSKITSVRLNKNLTQIEASTQAGVSKRTLERLESGNSIQLSSFLRIMRVLGLLEAFNTILPEPTISPMAQLQLRSKQRQRASKKTIKATTPSKPWTWGNES